MMKSNRATLEELGLCAADIQRSRVCADCRRMYTIEEFLGSSAQYFGRPHDYAHGCLCRCLACHLGVGPNDKNPDDDSILRDYASLLVPGVHLVVMPLARATLREKLKIGSHATLYPPGNVDLGELSLRPNDPNSKSLAERISAMTRIDLAAVGEHVTIAFPIAFDWDALCKTSHKNHMEAIRSMSEIADDLCLNLLRYRLCTLEPVDALPARAGQVDSNHMMAAALLYNATRQEGRIIAGAAFTHFITRGVGLPLEPIEPSTYEQGTEVGAIVKRALMLYSELLEVNNSTSKFVQALALLEVLAYPYDFQKFQKVKKVISRYLATTQDEYRRLLVRFEDLTGKRDPETGAYIGYRTRMVHLGNRLDELLPSLSDRLHLFAELDGYIRPVIDHMLMHSHLTFDEYTKVRAKLGPFETDHAD